MNKDFNDLLLAFNEFEVRYLIVGGYAYARYTEPRATKDLDLFVRPDPGNGLSIFKALAAYGAHLRGVTAADFASPGTIFQIGVAPLRVDIINRIDGITFDEAWLEAEIALSDDTIPVRYLSLNHLIVNKLAAGRPQDLLDVANLRNAVRK